MRSRREGGVEGVKANVKHWANHTWVPKKKMSLSLEFQLKTQTQNSPKMSYSTQNSNPKLIENETQTQYPNSFFFEFPCMGLTNFHNIR